MDFNIIIPAIRKKITEMIREAATQGNSEVIIRYSDMLLAVDRIEEGVADLEDKIMRIRNQIQIGSDSKNVDIPLATSIEQYTMNVSSAKAEGRKLGRLARSELLSDLKERGLSLTQQKGSLYTNRHGGFIAIAFSTERQSRRFFLGAPRDKSYQAVILLCRTDAGRDLRFVLPGGLIASLHDKLANEDQLKFNIKQSHNSYVLAVPGGEKIGLSEYESNYSSLEDAQ